MEFDLGGELIGVVEGSQGMVAGLTQEFALTRLDQFSQQVQDIRCVLLELVKQGAGDGEGALEGARAGVLTGHVQQHGDGGAVAFVGDLAADFRVGGIVKVATIGVENTVPANPVRLMHLKIEEDARHVLEGKRTAAGRRA
jgi:hypothetical protein